MGQAISDGSCSLTHSDKAWNNRMGSNLPQSNCERTTKNLRKKNPLDSLEVQL
ncbi:hypothetical protein GO684_02255 [Wolbachia endosymbiont of Litomosoides brasiliensis]|nr:hypothetical protein [Wolbachia endosymbiont of Litomosoides brasiliensis]